VRKRRAGEQNGRDQEVRYVPCFFISCIPPPKARPTTLFAITPSSMVPNHRDTSDQQANTFSTNGSTETCKSGTRHYTWPPT
jgi:hypothetical protein